MGNTEDTLEAQRRRRKRWGNTLGKSADIVRRVGQLREDRGYPPPSPPLGTRQLRRVWGEGDGGGAPPPRTARPSDDVLLLLK